MTKEEEIYKAMVKVWDYEMRKPMTEKMSSLLRKIARDKVKGKKGQTKLF